tara:strand:+ start:138 stop:695 length:558 start_codon:yes stop_codon:yes gene_type:complete
MVIKLSKIFVLKLSFIILVFSMIPSCSSIQTKTERHDINDVIYHPRERYQREKIAREGSFIKDLFIDKSEKNNFSKERMNLSVNPYLWKASLDILSSTMPLASVDSNSGLIISDWYTLKNRKNERVKISVLISTQELRADGLKVSMFKEVQKGNSWQNMKVNPQIITKLERKIIQKAGFLADQSE